MRSSFACAALLPTALLSAALLLAATSCQSSRVDTLNATAEPAIPQRPLEILAGKPVARQRAERHFRNLRQLTFDGRASAVRWSNDGRRLIVEATREPFACDQVYVLDLTSGVESLISLGEGRATSGVFLQGDDAIAYASTHAAGADCPPVGSAQKNTARALPATSDVFRAAADGGEARRLTETAGFDGELDACPVTGRLVFTSTRDGDGELYAMEPDGSDLTRLTERPGFDGSPRFSPSGTRIVFSIGPERDAAAQTEDRTALEAGWTEPASLEIATILPDGSERRVLTEDGAQNLTPSFHPDDRRITFASNAKGDDFELYLMDATGGARTRITHSAKFDGSPVFSPDGRHFAFVSARDAETAYGLDVFVAEWIDRPRR